MLYCALPARAYGARIVVAGILAAFAIVLTGFAAPPAWSAPKDIRWGTGPVGSSGGKALVVLANVLNKAMPDYRITVLPTPGAVTTVKGFATGEFDGTYMSDVALHEFATDSGRFKGFKAMAKRTPVQSFWCYTLDVGLAIKRANKDKFKSWADLKGMPVYTGPLPFDTRKHLENALAALDVGHVYKQVDLSTAGSQLDSGSIDAMILYVSGGKTPAPWISEASLAVDWAPLNPSSKEVSELEAKHFQVIDVDPSKFNSKEKAGSRLALLPFFWGFSLGMDVPAEDMYRMLKTIEQHADELAQLDPDFAEIGGGQMAAFQKRALQATWDLVPIHPGLKKYLEEKGMWDSKWSANIAK